MAVPDPYKAAKPKAAMNAVRNTGTVPPPTAANRPGLGAIKSNGGVPKPMATTKVSSGITPIKAPSNTIPAPPAQNKSAISTPQMTDWVAKQNEQYANLEKLINTPFSYNPETDPAYQAQRQLAQLRAGDASRNALETANEKGILGSSMNVSQLGQIQQRAEQEAAAYIPEYRNQAYGQYQDQLRSVGELLGQARNLRGDRFDESVTLGEMTGSIKTPELERLENELIDYKTSTEQNWSKMNEQQRAAARAEGDRIRSMIDAAGGNSALFGADVASGAARGNTAKSGVQTLAGQAQSYNQMDRDRLFDYGVDRDERSDFVTDREFEYSQGRDKVADEQWTNEFNRLIANDDFDRALQMAQQRVDESRERRLASGGGGGSGGGSSSSGDYYEASAADMNEMFDTLATQFSTYDNNTGETTMTKDPVQLRSLVESILDFELPDEQTANLLRRFGISQKRAEELLKASSGSSGSGTSSSTKKYTANNPPSPTQIMRDTLGL